MDLPSIIISILKSLGIYYFGIRFPAADFERRESKRRDERLRKRQQLD